MLTGQSPEVEPAGNIPQHSCSPGEDLDLWKRKYQGLKRKCREYQEINSMLFLRAKRIHRVIENAEAETRYLVKKLEQYEEVDFPKCLPSARAEANGLRLGSSPLLSPTAPNQQVFRAAAATRIRTELELALSQDIVPSNENGPGPNRAHYSVHVEGTNGSSSNLTTADNSSSHTYSSPNHHSQTIVQGPPRLVPIAAASSVTLTDKAPPSSSKTKKTKRNLKAASDKQLKPGLKGAAAAKRRKGEIDPNAPKKPSNAFFWFCQARRARLQEQFKGEGVTGQHDLTKALAKLWGETNTEDKKPFYEQYAVDKARYDREIEDYLKKKQALVSSPSVPVVTNQITDTGTFTVTIADPES